MQYPLPFGNLPGEVIQEIVDNSPFESILWNYHDTAG